MNAEPMRALIAEDDVLVANVIENELGKIGVVVIAKAADGLQAVELACSLTPDVILMDVEMPEMNGLEAARQIQARCAAPVVVLTVYGEKEVAEEAAAAGVGAFVIKPPRAHELERAILIARARFADLGALRRKNIELQEALARVKTLSGLLPICARCKRIRDDQGYWQQVEVYIRSRSDAEFSHGLCPDCKHTLYPPEDYPYLYEKEK
jgi:two-component system, response regulator PdtaR